MSITIGLLGTGSLAEYVVCGLRSAGWTAGIVVSPRNGDVAARLATAYGVAVGCDNQDVCDRSDLLLVCLPARIGIGILKDLRFRVGQAVCSAMAGVGVAEVSAAVSPATACLTMMPGASNAIGEGPCLLYPDLPEWHAVLAHLGPVLPVQSTTEFVAAAVFGAMSGASYVLMQHLADWFEARGIERETARRLVALTFHGNAGVLKAAPQDWPRIIASVATPGGVTEQLVDELARSGSFEGWINGLGKIFDRMAEN